MLGTESVLSALRATPVQLDMRPHWIETSMAEQLGLQDGQVVQALVDKKDGRVRLWLKDFSFELPNGWVLKDGDKPFLRVNANPGGWGLLIQTPTDAAVVENPNLALAGLVGKGSAQALSASGSAPAETVASPSATSNRLNTLVFQPPGFAAFRQLLQMIDMRAPQMMQLSLEQSELLARISGFGLSMGQLQPMGLRKALAPYFKSVENQLSQRQKVEDEPRSLIRQLLGSLGEEDTGASVSGLSEELHKALNELEAAQVQSAIDHNRGELNLRLMLPFTDADPVELHFQRPPRKPGDESPPLSVDIHSQSRLLGEVWLHTLIKARHQVELTMWALREEVAQQARVHATELVLELGAAGLELQQFQIYNAPRPGSDLVRTPPDRGLVVDALA
ncbi:MAG: hypothetical protein EBT49_06075 [Betaproteobacteria bacterium]|jgi:hypothetical protein|nr:hypothetical protein [Betaproteobacteria bacterium]